MVKKMKVDVLGTKYTIKRVDAGKDEYMEKMSFGGYCDCEEKKIVILNARTCPGWENSPEAIIKDRENETLRHELIHAFLNESGLRHNSHIYDMAWAKNEEMVDWFAIQMPKIMNAFKEVGCI